MLQVISAWRCDARDDISQPVSLIDWLLLDKYFLDEKRLDRFLVRRAFYIVSNVRYCIVHREYSTSRRWSDDIRLQFVDVIITYRIYLCFLWWNRAELHELIRVFTVEIYVRKKKVWLNSTSFYHSESIYSAWILNQRSAVPQLHTSSSSIPWFTEHPVEWMKVSLEPKRFPVEFSEFSFSRLLESGDGLVEVIPYITLPSRHFRKESML